MQGEEEMGGLDQSSRGGEKAEAGAEVVEEGEEEVVLPGFRFHPTDEELIGFYLRRKVDNKHTSIELIKQIDIYKYDPWDLPKVSTGGEKEWYFFCLRGRKYRNSIRPNRVTGSGFWKATGIDRPIYSAAPGGNSGDCIGLKKSLVYYRGSAGKGTKTDWMMHEFRLPPNSPSIQEAEIWTICRILKRNATNKKYTQVWKGSNSKRIPIPTDSSSFESDARDTYNSLGASAAAQQGEKPAATAASYFEESNKHLLADQWNPTSALHQSIPTPIANELYKDGNWDELGRIMEYMMDPGLVYGCRYP